MTEVKFDKCSFCKKSGKQVCILICSDESAICEKCIGAVTTALADWIYKLAMSCETNPEIIEDKNN